MLKHHLDQKLQILSNLVIQFQIIDMDNKGFFNFSSGCAINLDDIGQFPDYHQVSQKLLKAIQLKSDKLDDQEVKIFLDADLEDVQHFPDFLELIRGIIQYEGTLSQKNTKLLIILLLKYVMSYFTSFSIEDKQASDIIKFLELKLISSSQQYLVLDFFLGLSAIASYSEQHQKVVDLFIKTIHQANFYEQQESFKKYIKMVDKFLRYRQFRRIFELKSMEENGHQLIKNFPILLSKLSKWSNKENCFELKHKIQAIDIKEHQFLKQYIENLTHSIKIV